MRGRSLSLVTAAAVAAGLTVVPASADAAQTLHVDGTGTVPDAYETIQAAVNAAEPGDAVLIHPGLYEEAVVVTTPDLRIRGTNRNAVVVDGDYDPGKRDGFLITAGGVTVENLTVARFAHNGIFWRGADDYAARYVTAFNNGLYGVYAYDSRGGVMEKSYASGNADSGFYIGGCWPCDAVIDDVDSYSNGLGYSGTNAGGNLTIRNSRWINNRGGILPNTLDSEVAGPQRGALIEFNEVAGSGNPAAPTTPLIAAATGIGIGVSGGSFNVIRDNAVHASSRYGIAVFPFPETTPNVYQANGNKVYRNAVTESGSYDLALAAGSGEQNCFGDNAHQTSDPPMIQTIYRCAETPYDNPFLNLPVSGSPVSAAELAAYYAATEAQGGAFACDASREDTEGCMPPDDQPDMFDPTGS